MYSVSPCVTLHLPEGGVQELVEVTGLHHEDRLVTVDKVLAEEECGTLTQRGEE